MALLHDALHPGGNARPCQSRRQLREKGAAKFFVYADGTSRMMQQGTLRDHEVPVIQDFIKQHYLEMFAKWQELSDSGFYGEST